MSVHPIDGVWIHASKTFAGENNFMSIDETRQRMINFAVISVDPVRWLPITMWYRWESGERLATKFDTKSRRDFRWHSHEVAFANDLLHLKNEYGDFVLKRLFPGEYPDWLAAELKAANAKMDEIGQPAWFHNSGCSINPLEFD